MQESWNTEMNRKKKLGRDSHHYEDKGMDAPSKFKHKDLGVEGKEAERKEKKMSRR